MGRNKEFSLVSTVLVAINIIVYVICTFTGEMLYNKGGLTCYDVVVNKEYLRIVWAMFLHADLEHLCNNMLVLFFMGGMLENAAGSVPFTIIYFLSGIGGNLVSLQMKFLSGDRVMSVGASGAIFGLDGLLLAMVLLSDGYWNKSRSFLTRVLLMIGLSLYNGFISSNIDNAGHVGGLIVGFIAGTVLCMVKRFSRR